MPTNDCKKLEKKYKELVEMLQESLDVYLKGSKEKDKRNEIFLNYKKRIYEEIKRLKQEIQIQQNIIQKYKEKDLQLTKENYILKGKFKHLSNIFKSKREVELLDKYFPQRIELEKIIMYSLRNLMREKFNPKDSNVLYFRKYFKIGMKDFLTKNIKSYIESEKLAIVVSQIILKEYTHFIYTLLAKELLDKINKYEEFLEILLTKDLLDKTKKYHHLNFSYSVDKIKLIVRHYHSLKVEEDVDNLSTQAEIDEISKKKKTLFKQKEELQKELEKLKNSETELLSLIVSETKSADLEEDEESEETKKTKRQLEKIDESKRVKKDKIIEIEKELTKLQNRELFLKPLLEVKQIKHVDEKEEQYKTEYDKLILDFSNVLIKDLK